jgi:hypothetical protein
MPGPGFETVSGEVDGSARASKVAWAATFGSAARPAAIGSMMTWAASHCLTMVAVTPIVMAFALATTAVKLSVIAFGHGDARSGDVGAQLIDGSLARPTLVAR